MILRSVRLRLNQYKQQRRLRDRQQRFREWFRDVVGSCAICGSRSFKDHSFEDLAFTERGDPDGDAELSRLIATRMWQGLSKYQNAESRGDIRVWRAIKCTTETVFIVPVVLTIELWDDDIPGEPIVLDESESADLDRFLGDRWERL